MSVLSLPGAAAAAPAPEYGPEAEARFLDRCTVTGESDGACRDLMEQLQAELGYAVFLEMANGGTEGFGAAGGERMATAAAPQGGSGKLR